MICSEERFMILDFRFWILDLEVKESACPEDLIVSAETPKI
jgi:hypothetical protein